MLLNLSQNYVVKGLGKEVKVDSIVEITTTEDGSRITKLHDKWNGELPSGPIRDVSISRSRPVMISNNPCIGLQTSECCIGAIYGFRAKGVEIVVA
jgi:hypothetical protein